MKGKIKAYSGSVNAGLITCTAGKLYRFSGAEWQEPALPEKGADVVFERRGSKIISVKAG